MLKIFFLFSFLAISVQSCRVIQDGAGGVEVQRDIHPSVVLIETFIAYDLKYYCQGVLITPTYVLTTARCVISSIFVNVHVYAYKLFDVNEEDREIYRVPAENLIFKPNFERYISHNDVALIRLPVTLNLATKNYKLAQLPTGPLTGNEKGVSVGWGLVDFYDEDEFVTERKHEIEVTFATQAECALAYPRLNWTFYGEGGRGCIYSTEEKNCVAGHGSPFFVNDVVHGLHSYAYYGCEDVGVLSGIQLTFYHMFWIRQISDYRG
jgi:secreted trypsin-like serine protease